MISLMVYRSMECKENELNQEYYNPDYIIRLWPNRCFKHVVNATVLIGSEVKVIYIDGMLDYVAGIVNEGLRRR